MKEYEKFADVLVNYSCELKKGEKVFVEYNSTDPVFLQVLIKKIREVGAYPFLFEKNALISKTLIQNCDETWCKKMTEYYLPIMKDMDAYISLHGSPNIYESSDIESDKTKLYAKHFVTPVHLEERVNHTKWVIANWPTPALAQNAKTSTEKYTQLYFKVCNLDYSKMSKAMDNLVEFMQKTDKVRLVGNGTDISFSIKGQPAIKCAGKNNIPDGEVFTAPIKNSVNGVIAYNIPTVYNGIYFPQITLVVENGKIIKATCGGLDKKLNEILDTDEGARFFGEFAIGVNPYIKTPSSDILFDEKICGSIHLTPGDCYDDCPNGNKSAIHWDMVLCQLEEYGGGEIYFDGKLIRKNGIFVIPELECLNEENLK